MQLLTYISSLPPAAKWFSFEEVRAAVKLATTSLTDPPPANYKEV